MSLKWRYWLFIGLIHLLLGVLVFQLLADQKAWFLLVEVGLLVSLALAYSLYRALIKPLDFLSSGVDAIADQDFSVRFRKTGSPEMNRLIEVYNGMLENIRMERAQVQEQHFFLDKLIRASPAGIILLDYDGHITDINPQARRMLQLIDSPYGKTLMQTEHPILNELSRWDVNQSGVLTGKGRKQFKCEVAQFVHRGFPRRFLLIQEMSNELVAAEKRAYGRVIRMMAHEVNNSIGAINSILVSTQDMLMEAPPSEEVKDVRDSLQVAIDRNDRLNQFMRNFAQVVRLPKAVRRQASLPQVLQNVHRLMLPMASQQKTQLGLRLAAADQVFPIDEQQMEQALVNMVKNALESLEWGGEVWLFLRKQPLEIGVADNGPGIPSEVATKLHMPFFSSKPQGQGVGLTLIREIARQHNGQFVLETLDTGWTESRLVFGSQ